MANAVQDAIAKALAGSTGQTQEQAAGAVRSVSTDSLKATSKSGN
jgi:hypothetical protein